MLSAYITELFGTNQTQDNHVCYDATPRQAPPTPEYRRQYQVSPPGYNRPPYPTSSPVVSSIRLASATLNVVAAAIEFFTAVGSLMNTPSRSNEDERRREANY